ncbi:MAG: hypothetical protein WCJ02_04880 [bacterium]
MFKAFKSMVKYYAWLQRSRLPQPKTIEDMLHYPDLCPQAFDVNYKAWLIRISRWGTVKITRSLFETVEVTSEQFLEYMNDDRNFDGFPKFTSHNTGTLTWEMERDIPVPNGKFVTEKFLFEITKLTVS